MPRRLLALLADGNVHSGESLGSALGLSRAAVWKQVQRLQEMGALLRAVKGAGYQLESPLELLDEAVIRSALDETAGSLVDQLDVHWSLSSTNTVCMQGMAECQSGARICLAEHQSSGRGRRGRHWTSPLAGNLYLSIGWRFAGGVEALEGLSLTVGLIVAEVLTEEFAVQGIGLKWPNDILCKQRKLGGILIEMSGDASGPCDVVIGLGLNVGMGLVEGNTIDQPWTDLFKETGVALSRNKLAAGILGRLLPMLASFESVGFSHYSQRWQDLDVFAGRSVMISVGDSHVFGKVLGVTGHGALLLDVDGVQRAFNAGEVSLRGG